MEEIFCEFENPNYLVSTFGRVYSKKSKKFLKPLDNGNGYLGVSLRVGEGWKRYYLHRLVATYFLVADVNCLQVDHLDGNKSNNRLDNLRWVNPSQNQTAIPKQQGKRYYKNGRSQLKYLTENDKANILAFYNEGFSSVEIGRKLNLKRQTIRSFIRRIKEDL